MDAEVEDARKIQHFLHTVEDYIKPNSPFVNKVFLFGTFGVSTGSLTYGLSCYDQYTPYNTNTMNVFVSLMCHLGIVVGPSALFALKFINYSVYPSQL